MELRRGAGPQNGSVMPPDSRLGDDWYKAIAVWIIVIVAVDLLLDATTSMSALLRLVISFAAGGATQAIASRVLGWGSGEQ